MKIFLLGSQGFLGSHLYKVISEQHIVVTDMRYFDDRYDLIINLAAVTHTQNVFDHKLIEANFILADRVFKRPEPILYASSCSAAHLTSPYSLSKLWNEHLGWKHGNAIGLRFFNCYGNNNTKGIVKFLTQQPDGKEITIRGPELVRDYIHVDDVIDSIIHCLQPYNWNFSSRIMEIGTGIGTKTIDLVKLYMKLSGKSFNIKTIPPDSSEPLSMVSSTKINCLSLEQGLLKTINQSK